MYTHILDSALRDRPPGAAQKGIDEALSSLLVCRQNLASAAQPVSGAKWSTRALADQLAYDIALIDLAACMGLHCDSTPFDPPARRRGELEQELIALGVPLEGWNSANHAALRSP